MDAKSVCLAWVLVTILFLSNVESKGFHLQGRILTGMTSSKGQFPHMVSLINRQNEFPICGGAIINNFYVLSSGYCAESYASYPKLLVVYLGAWNFDDKVLSDIKEVTLHPKYNASTKENDIALIRMKNRIIFTDLLKPIALPTEDFPNENGINVFVSGFGLWFVSIGEFKLN